MSDVGLRNENHSTNPQSDIRHPHWCFMASLTYIQLLGGNRSFRRLWLGQVVSELGNWFNFIAGLGLVRAVSGGAPEVTAALLVSRIAPFALFAPIAGALVDRWSRRKVMIVADIVRAVFALGFLLVEKPEHLWFAYLCSVVMALFTALFEAAKNAATPNITGDEGLLAGNALMFSSRFLLMAIGAALGGWTSDIFGYQSAFIVNSLSFLVSAYSVWLISEGEMKQTEREKASGQKGLAQVQTDIKEGWKFILSHRLVGAIVLVNIVWATGGGMTNLISDQLGSVVFANEGWLKGERAIAALWTAAGLGLFIGMLLVHRVATYIELHKLTVPFIGWTLFAHGIIFGLAGFMPSIWLACLLYLVSRALLGVEYAVQDTMLMRLIPDNLRGRVGISDRAAEVSVMSLSTYIAGYALHIISPQKLTLISGLLAASPGIMWLLFFASGKLTLPQFREKKEKEEKDDAASEQALATS
jgi:MFS family permease